MLVPDLKAAITDFTNEDEYSKWAAPFITQVANICLPKFVVTLLPVFNPQEESKD